MTKGKTCPICGKIFRKKKKQRYNKHFKKCKRRHDILNLYD